MKVAITVWEGRVSPVFDSAQTLWIAEILNSEIIGETYQDFNPNILQLLQEMLTKLGVNVLLCGAISEEPAYIIEVAGIELISFITGEVEEVLSTYIHGNPTWSKVTMPGCTKNVYCRGRICQRKKIRHQTERENEKVQATSTKKQRRKKNVWKI